MRFSKLIKLVASCSIISLLSACASSIPNDFFRSEPVKDYSNMYLRGVFNWWEASENFKLSPVSANTFSVTIELIADGQPYAFKVADATWSMSLNCGSQFESSPMRLEDVIELNCEADSLNLEFTPKETGNYRFLLDVSNNSEPELSIIKIG